MRIIERQHAIDYRGEYLQLWKRGDIHNDWGEDCVSISRKNVLRGIHGDSLRAKLITCLSGAFYLVILNCVEDHKQYGKWMALTLTDIVRQSVYVPAGFGNGHLVLSETALFHYKQTGDYIPENQFTVKWNDPRFNIHWPINNPILSLRDS